MKPRSLFLQGDHLNKCAVSWRLVFLNTTISCSRRKKERPKPCEEEKRGEASNSVLTCSLNNSFSLMLYVLRYTGDSSARRVKNARVSVRTPSTLHVCSNWKGSKRKPKPKISARSVVEGLISPFIDPQRDMNMSNHLSVSLSL